jgi:hypothetical protein
LIFPFPFVLALCLPFAFRFTFAFFARTFWLLFALLLKATEPLPPPTACCCLVFELSMAELVPPVLSVPPHLFAFHPAIFGFSSSPNQDLYEVLYGHPPSLFEGMKKNDNGFV